MQITTKGQFGGIGIEVTQEDGLIKVISPIDGTPASRAGINRPATASPGSTAPPSPDCIYFLNEAIDKMRGAAGSNFSITLTILREGEEEAVRCHSGARHRIGGFRQPPPAR